MEIEWVKEANVSVQNTLDYWDEINKFIFYADKIIDAVEKKKKYRKKILIFYQKM